MPNAKSNPANDRTKRHYLLYLTEAKQRAKSTAEQARRAIDRFEEYTGYKDFATFNADQAMGFKKSLTKTKAKQSDRPISLSTIDHTLHVLREFFHWLCQRQGYKRIVPADIAYLNISAKERREANTPNQKAYPTLEQVHATLAAMPANTDAERRDRALLAFTAVTGIRDAALISLKLKHVSPAQRRVYQDAREVRTKFSKTMEVFFFPVAHAPAWLRDPMAPATAASALFRRGDDDRAFVMAS
ncbi:MAG: site-specific integrase [Bdellovibrionales bacterium]